LREEQNGASQELSKKCEIKLILIKEASGRNGERQGIM
jgi:hypothetical protein